MIELTFNTLFMLYLSITLTSVLGIWIYSHYRTRRRIIFTSDQTLYICEFCHFAYVTDSAKKLNQCPQCSLFNKHNTYQHSHQNKKIKIKTQDNKSRKVKIMRNLTPDS